MGSHAIEVNREDAEVYHGAALCAEKSTELLAEMRLPLGLLPLAEMEEFGYNRTTGFMWLLQKKAITHTFRQGPQVSYAAQVTAVVEPHRMKRMTGVKIKELLTWIALNELLVDDDHSTKIIFKTPAGIARAYPIAVFAKERDDGKPNPKDAPATAAGVSGK